jgi:hypothetical protein
VEYHSKLLQQLHEVGCVVGLLRKTLNKVGGDSTIEVHYSLFSKIKSSAGRVLPQQWKVGRICR